MTKTITVIARSEATKQSNALRHPERSKGSRDSSPFGLRMTEWGLLRLRLVCCLAMTMFFFCDLPHAYACPLCKEAISKMGEIWTALGFNWSIYFMMSVPFLLVAGFILVLYVQNRKHRP